MDPFTDSGKNEEYIITVSNAQPENHLFDYENTLAVPFECPPGKRWLVALHSITMSNHIDTGGPGNTDLEEIATHIRHLDRLNKTMADDEFKTFLEKAIVLAKKIDYANAGKEHLTMLFKQLQAGQMHMKLYEKKLITKQKKQTYTKGDLAFMKRTHINLKRVGIWYDQFRTLASKLNEVFKLKWHEKNSHLYSPIFVELEQLLPSNACVEKRIGSFFLNHDLGSTHYQPLHHNFFPIQNQYLNKLNIKIKNHKNRILEGLPSNPTIVELILKPEDMDDLYDHRTCYITNENNQNAFNFTVELPAEFTDFTNNNKWEMAMVRCCVPNNIFTLPEGLYIEIIERFRSEERVGIPVGQADTLNQRSVEEVLQALEAARNDLAHYHVKYSLDLDYNPTTKELAKKVTDIVTEMNGFQGQAEGEAEREVFNDHRDLAHNYHIEANFNENIFNFTSNRRLVFVMPYTVAVILGFERQVRMLGPDSCYVEFDDSRPPNSPQLRDYDLNSGQVTEKGLHAEKKRYSLTSDEMLEIDQYKPQNLLVECDCLAPTIVGNAYGQYLSYLPLNEVSNAFTEFSPLHPEYHEINTNVLNRVNFKFSQIDGQIPRLLYPDAYNNAYLTLSFRRRRNKDAYRAY